jgi:hypothetical protein
MSTKTTKHLFEAATLVSESASEDGTWVVQLIAEGKGSSGTYPATLLENHHHAFDGVLSFKNHPQWFEGPETRDFTMLAGQVIGETWVDTNKQGKRAIFANYLPDPEYKDKLARYRDKLGLSIYIEGSGYDDEETGEFMVDWFNPEDPYASVDVVIAPGARGKLTEAMKQTYSRNRENEPGAEASAQEPHERKLRMEKEIQEALEKVNSTLASEAARADLLPSQVESLRAEAKAGTDVTARIEEAKTIAKEAREAFEGKQEESASTGRTFGDRKVESAVDLGKVFG